MNPLCRESRVVKFTPVPIFCLTCTVLWLAALAPAQVAGEDENASIASLRQLSVEQLAERRQVRVRATITQRLGYWFIVD